MMVLQPVMVRVGDTAALRTPHRVTWQRRCARAALRECARRCGAPEGGWRKNEREAPLPQQGFFWSVSHKRHFAAAVIADRPVGIDLERIVPRREAMFDEVASGEEWTAVGGRSWPAFFRIWTAKEAVLKASGIGMAGWDRCRLVDVLNSGRAVLDYADRLWRVAYFHHEDHIAAVTADVDTVVWSVLDELPISEEEGDKEDGKGGLCE